jgi:hypothetical protein
LGLESYRENHLEGRQIRRLTLPSGCGELVSV